jgi:hypothetical protein
MNNQRLFPRFQFQEPVGYQQEFAEQSGSLARNISLGGIKLTVHEFVPMGTLLEMQIHLDHPSRDVLVKGKVMWIKELFSGESFEVGVEFIKEAQPVEAIGTYITSRRFDPI